MLWVNLTNTDSRVTIKTVYTLHPKIFVVKFTNIIVDKLPIYRYDTLAY